MNKAHTDRTQTVLITGVSRGIGRALAETFLAQRFRVIGTSLSGTTDLTHGQLTLFQLDLADPASIASCALSINNLNTPIDIFINNAGALFDDKITELQPELLRKTLEVNLIGTTDLTERLLPTVAPEGHIIFISSSAGSLSETDYKTHSHHPNQYPAYKISKAALNMYMRTLAMRLEHDPRKIIASSVHPGWVQTDMGGDDAPLSPQEAAQDIYTFALSRPQSGYFWHKGKNYPW